MIIIVYHYYQQLMAIPSSYGACPYPRISRKCSNPEDYGRLATPVWSGNTFNYIDSKQVYARRFEIRLEIN